MIFLNSETKKTIFSAILGHVFERYEVILYGFYAPYLASKFFPHQNHLVSLLSSMGTFAAGFLMRPIGGMIFGYIGDKFGRRRALLSSILFVSVPTTIIGCLPTYDLIGILAPVILIICRLMQGLCVGGEYTGATIFLYEHAPQKKTGFIGSLVNATGFTGATIATLIASICTSALMPEWGWRISFILGGVFAPIIFLLRRSMLETPPFEGIIEDKKVLNFPLKQVFKTSKRNIMTVMGVGVNGHVPLYIVTIYMNTILEKELGISQSQLTLINTLILINWIIFILIFGFISDYVGKARLMRWSALSLIIVAYPIFWYAYNDISIEKIILLELLLTFFGAAFLGPSAGWLPELFPVNERYSGIGFSLTMGQAILGGMTPLISTFLVAWLNDPKSPAFLIILGGIFGWLSTTYFAPLAKKS